MEGEDDMKEKKNLINFFVACDLRLEEDFICVVCKLGIDWVVGVKDFS